MDRAQWQRLRPVLEGLLALDAAARLPVLRYLDARDPQLAGELRELLPLDGEEVVALDPPRGASIPWLDAPREDLGPGTP